MPTQILAKEVEDGVSKAISTYDRAKRRGTNWEVGDNVRVRAQGSVQMLFGKCINAPYLSKPEANIGINLNMQHMPTVSTFHSD
jgi:hypothetical protein